MTIQHRKIFGLFSSISVKTAIIDDPDDLIGIVDKIDDDTEAVQFNMLCPKCNLLGLMLLSNVKTAKISDALMMRISVVNFYMGQNHPYENSEYFTPMNKALAIIRAHLIMDERDLLNCQDELIEAGLEDYARI